MRNPDQDILLFFSGHEEALGLYEIFEDFLYSAFPDANRRVQKTQITFFNRHVFACVSFARVLCRCPSCNCENGRFLPSRAAGERECCPVDQMGQ